MESTKLFLAPACVGTGIELVGVAPDYYVDGVKQTEPVGFKYAVLLREHNWDRLTVRISGPQQIDNPLSGTSLPVAFTDLRVRPYVNRATGQLAFSATASGIKPVNSKT